MSKLTEKFREKKVFNPFDFYGDQPYITYRLGHSVISACWAVAKSGLNLGQVWYDHGCRTFGGYGEPGEGSQRVRGLRAAQAWARKYFGIKEWARDPFGSYGEAEFVKKRIKELK